jgi:hypothetical protein
VIAMRLDLPKHEITDETSKPLRCSDSIGDDGAAFPFAGRRALPEHVQKHVRR